MTTLAEHMIVVGADNRPPMLDKSIYNSWSSRMLLYIKGKEEGRIMLNSVLEGPLVYGTIEVDGVMRLKIYEELSNKEKLQVDCDLCATNIVLQGLPPNVYSLVNHHHVAKKIRIEMTMQQVQVNTKFHNSLPPEWSKFVTNVKLAKDMHTSNYDQLYAYLSQHEAHAQEVCVMRERYSDPLALGEVGYSTSLGMVHVKYSAYAQESGQTDDLDAYNSNCDDLSLSKAVLMDNLSSYDSDILFEVPQHNTYQNDDMINQSVQET
ncbi:hypothetical protein Tco_0755422 [Tanacetum coccineum]